ncbi:sensor histidine kinase [Anaeroselena agilis]|uniref:histidine kinase n=1 Tax=Anaeroselena agilis TaxID=3063788 RepID=A0ABU3NTJ9_9FIRM|nr:HAMP domain-containing sensor histidine kinase [Selenomonadales bacterium 4137-cl]
MKISLQYKLLISFMAVVFVVVAGVMVSGSALIREFFLASKQHELTDKAYEMARMVNSFYAGRITHGQLQNFVNSVDSFLDARVWVVDNKLNLITVSEERPDEGQGNRRPAAVVKPSPLRQSMWDCDWPGNPTTSPSQQNQQGIKNPGSGQNQSAPSPAMPPAPNKGMWDCDASGEQSWMGGRQGGQNMLGMWGRPSAPANQTAKSPQVSTPVPVDPPNSETKLAVEKDTSGTIVLDIGKGPQQPGQADSVPVMSLSDIKGLQELVREVEANTGKTWAKTYYHPYYEENMLIVAVPLQRADGTIGGTVMINAPIQGIDGFLRQIYYYIGMAGLAGIFFAILLVSYLSGSIVRPLKFMKETAAAMARGDYNSHVDVKTNDEVGDLGQSLNSLAKDLGNYVGQMEKMDKVRRDFVANVSHELRTPLTIMRGYNQALQDGTITDPALVNKYHRVMGDEIMRLEKLIAELLDLSQLQANGVTLEIEPLSLAEVADNVVTMLKQRSEEKGVELVGNISHDLPNIIGDGDRLTQVVLILLDNALKFTPSGGRIAVDLEVKDGTEILTVSDTGTGIPPQDLPYIWERFYKADKSRGGGGTGLGLSIAKQIIELHGAKVNVESQPGKGTKFIIKFPLND